MSERATFSPFWHRVRTMTPRLRPHVQITRQHYRGRRWHVVRDPTSNQFYRLNPIAHEFVGLLDGVREVEVAWRICLEKFGDAAPTQNEVIQLISQLYSANLLSVDATPETEQLLRRGRERLKKKIQQQAIGIMYFRMRLFNPDRVLSALEPVVRPLISVWGLAAWVLLVGFALSQLLPHWSELTDRGRFESTLAPSNWGWLIVVWVVTKAIHESGHGLICKRYGGQVPEFGAMLLVLFPAPYVDASSCWAFPSKWKRMAVGAGGMLFELTLASLAAILWSSMARTGEEGLARQLAYNVMLTSGISTLLFNANPLMRFDGYYILSDLLEMPNLSQRANKMLKYLMLKYVYRTKRQTPVSAEPFERSVLVAYGLAALVYRVFLFVTITLYVMGKLFVVGLLLAVWTAAAWFVIPVGAFIHWHATSPQLSDRRLRAWATSAAMALTAIVLLGLVPMPDYRRGNGVVESLARTGVYFETDGFVTEAHARPGDALRAGDPIVTQRSEDLEQMRERVTARIAELGVDERAAIVEGEPAVAELARSRVSAYRDQLAEIEKRIRKLVVKAPHNGVLVGPDPNHLVGGFVRRGDALCEVVDAERVRIAASMDQRQSAWLFEPGVRGALLVEFRLVSDVSRVRPATVTDVIDAGQMALPHGALGYAGGGKVETDPQDKHGMVSKRPRFTVYLEPTAITDAAGADIGEVSDPSTARIAGAGFPGERVRVRFELPPKPLMAQWLDRLRKTIQGRVNI